MDLQPQTAVLKTERRTLRLDATRPEDIARAAEILRAGGLVAFPTETVYGLGANALSPEAVERIFVAKKRPHWDPLIVHIADRAMLATLWDQRVWGGPSFQPHRKGGLSSEARPSFPSTASVLSLIEKFWPGPLTLLLPRTAAIPDAVTAGRPLVGVRMPAHPVALELIRLAGLPIAAPSANLFGHTSPTTAAHVLADLDGRIDAVLDGGPTTVGLESTVIGPYSSPDEFFNHGFVIYRPGSITFDMLMAEVGAGAIHLHTVSISAEPGESLPSPGLDLRHYAPRARLILIDALLEFKSQEAIESALVDAIDSAYDGKQTMGVMLPNGWNPSCAQLIYPWADWSDGKTLAARLFAGLRDLDDRGATVIICPVPAMDGIGEAIRDRLKKAARPA